MWLVPHFVALDVAGVATQLFQSRPVASIYQAQSDPVFDAAMRRGRLRFGQGELFSRRDTARPLVRAIRRGHAFFNLPDMDFGLKDAAFVPFFGVPAATLLAPSQHGARAGHGGAAGGGRASCPAARATACASCRPGPTGPATTRWPTRGA